jgi:hypothetical protein
MTVNVISTSVPEGQRGQLLLQLMSSSGYCYFRPLAGASEGE